MVKRKINNCDGKTRQNHAMEMNTKHFKRMENCDNKDIISNFKIKLNLRESQKYKHSHNLFERKTFFSLPN